MRNPDWRTRHCAEPAVARANEATGRDIWKEIGDCPRSWREAKELYERLGVRTLAEAVTKVLGPPIDPSEARAGDIVFDGTALGICRGNGAAEFINGYQLMKKVTLAWSANATCDLGGDTLADASAHRLNGNCSTAA